MKNTALAVLFVTLFLDLLGFGEALRNARLAFVKHGQDRLVGPAMQRKRHHGEAHEVHREQLLVEPEPLQDFRSRIRHGQKKCAEHKIVIKEVSRRAARRGPA